MIYNFNFKGSTYEFQKKEDRDKYIVFACAKNEDEYITEWVEHYLNLGFDKIIIADNNDDNTKIPFLLKEYIEKDVVQIFDCHNMTGFQLYIYNMYLKEGNYKWCAYFDCDEFLELNIHKNIKEFLEPIKEDCVLINWMLFGSNGNIHKEKGDLQKRFKLPVSPISLFKENMYVKPIIRGNNNYEKLIDTHCPIGNGDISYNIGGYYPVNYSSHVYYPPRYRYAYVKHYYTKSFTEWISNKTKRGWPDEMPNILKESNYFILQNNEKFPIIKFTNGLFVDNNEYETIAERHKEVLENYDIIELIATTKNFYSLEMVAYSMLKSVKNHIFVILDSSIDDNFYNSLLEYSFNTSNKVFWITNQDEIWKIYDKYSTKNNGTFYYFDCR